MCSWQSAFLLEHAKYASLAVGDPVEHYNILGDPVRGACFVLGVESRTSVMHIRLFTYRHSCYIAQAGIKLNDPLQAPCARSSGMPHCACAGDLWVGRSSCFVLDCFETGFPSRTSDGT